MLFGRRFSAGVGLILVLVTSACGGGEETETGSGGGGGAAPVCAVGEVELTAGGCAPTGVPEGACAAGFEWRDAGCYPRLPDAPCEAGLMALPGETTCREVGPCGDAPWGDIPVEADTVYVDGAFTGAPSDGTAAAPFKTVQEGIAAASSGAIVALAAGSYAGAVQVLAKPVRLWGRCPAMVELTGGTASQEATLELTDLHEPVEIRDVAVTGVGFGVSVTGADDVLFDQVWVHDTQVAGIAGVDAFGVAKVRIERSLVEHTGQTGVLGAGSEVAIAASEIRDIEQRLGAPVGAAVTFVLSPQSLAPTHGSIDGSVIHGSRGGGVLVFSSDVAISASVIHDVLPLTNGQDGEGLIVKTESGGPRAFGEVATSSILRSHEAGVLVLDADLIMDAVTVSETLAQAVDDTGGNGVAVHAPSSGVPSLLTLRQSLVEQSLGFGVFVSDAGATIEGTRIRDTLPMPSEGVFGDGATAVSYRLATTLTLVGSHVSSSARAGVTNFSSSLSLWDDRLWCNEIDLDGEITTAPFSFEGVDTTRCGCDGDLTTCEVVSTNLQPPTPI